MNSGEDFFKKSGFYLVLVARCWASAPAKVFSKRFVKDMMAKQVI